MSGITYRNHTGPNDLFGNLRIDALTPTDAIPGYDVAGTDLGTVFNVEYEIEKGETTTKANLPIFVTPGRTIPGPPVITVPERTFMQVLDNSVTPAKPKLVEITKIKYREVEVHVVDNSTTITTPRKTLTIKKTIAVIEGADGKDYPTSIEVSKNGGAIANLRELAHVPLSPDLDPTHDIAPTGTRKTLDQMRGIATEVTVAANFPDPSKVVLVDGSVSPNPQIDVLSEKEPSITYSRITKGDSRVKRFSTSRYNDRDNIEEIGIEYYLKFTHTKAAATGKEPTNVKDEIAVTVDCNGQVFVTMDYGSGEQNYVLEGMGTAKPPVKEGEESYTEDEVVYLDVINDKGQKDRIYLPAEKSKNAEFVENLKRTLEKKNQHENMDEVAAHKTRELSHTLMNEVFAEDKIPSGPLSYKKDGKTFLYIPCENGAPQNYLNFSQKDGDTSLYVNLDKVDNPTPPPPQFPDDTTYRVIGYECEGGANGKIKLKISDGKKVYSVVTPVEAKDMPDLFNPPVAPAVDYTPKYTDPAQIVTGTTFTEVDEKTIPVNKNAEGHSTVEEEDLTKIPEDKKLKTTKSTKGVALATENKSFSFEGGPTPGAKVHNIDTITQEIGLKETKPGAPTSQKISTFSDEGTGGTNKDDVLLMVTSDDTAKYPSGKPPIVIKRDGTDGKKTKVYLSEEEATRLGITDLADLSKNRDGYYEFEATGVQLSENLTVGGLTLKAKMKPGKTARNFNLAVESQGVMLQDVDNHTTHSHTEDSASMDMAVSRQYLNDCLDPASTRQFKGVFQASPPAAPGTLQDFDKMPESFKQLLVMQTKLYRAQQEALRTGTPPDLVNGDPNKPLVVGDPPKYELYSIPSIDDAGNVVYSDFVKDISTGKMYYYGHTSNEEQKNRTKPRYHEVKQGYLGREGSSARSYKYHVVIEEPHRAGETNKGVEIPVDPAQNRDMFNFVRNNLGDPQDVATAEGRAKPARKRGGTDYNDGGTTQKMHTYDYDPLGKAKVIDDNVASMEKEVEQHTPQPVEHIGFPDPDRKVGPTVDEIVPQKAPKKDWTQLWKGISDGNKKTWVAAFAIITLLSVFLPFLALISGPLLGIMVASDTGLFTDIWLRPTNYRHSRFKKRCKEIDGKGLQIEKQIAKNQDRIMDIDIMIESIDNQIAEIKKDPKLTEAQKQAKIKQLEKEKAGYQTEKANIAKENANLAVELAVHTDKKLILLKEEQERLHKASAQVKSLQSTTVLVNGTYMKLETTTARDKQIKIIDQLLAKGNKKNIDKLDKKMLEQQKIYLLAEEAYESAVPPAKPVPLSKEDAKMAAKYGFDQEEYNETRKLMEEEKNGTISKDGEKRLKELKKRYGLSPFAALFGYSDSIDSEIASTEAVDRAIGERFGAEHPDEHGMVDYEIKHEKTDSETKSGDTSNRSTYDPTQPKKQNPGEKIFGE